MKKVIYIIACILSMPLTALAALDVTFTTDTNYTTNGIALTVKSGSNVDGITTDDVAGNLTIYLSPGATITITAAGNALTVNPTQAYVNGTTCTANSSSVTLTEPSTAQGTTVVTVTPSASLCGSSSSGGGGGGGGGLIISSGFGGGSSLSQVTPSTLQQPISSPQAAFGGFSRDLSFGSRGDDVKYLQQLLAKDHSIYPSGKITGFYGSLTKKAVRAFQKKYGLSSIGRVGPLTRAKLIGVYGVK